MNTDSDALARDLRKLFAASSLSFDPGEAQEVRMFLDAGEYGLAFETICSALAAKMQPVLGSTYAQIVELGERMQIDPKCWRALEVR